MARLDTTQLVGLATDLGHRAYQVQQDPAVQKACGEVGDDAARLATSLGRAATEIGAAWRRAGRADGRGATGTTGFA
jgi:hypothetical protein